MKELSGSGQYYEDWSQAFDLVVVIFNLLLGKNLRFVNDLQ